MDKCLFGIYFPNVSRLYAAWLDIFDFLNFGDSFSFAFPAMVYFAVFEKG